MRERERMRKEIKRKWNTYKDIDGTSPSGSLIRIEPSRDERLLGENGLTIIREGDQNDLVAGEFA